MLNKALRLVRVYHDLSQVDAAERLGLSKSYVSEIEKGDKNVSLAVLQKYSDAFDIPLSSLLLFAEKVEGGGKSESVRVFVADKAVKMLDWVAAISDYRGSER